MMDSVRKSPAYDLLPDTFPEIAERDTQIKVRLPNPSYKDPVAGVHTVSTDKRSG